MTEEITSSHGHEELEPSPSAGWRAVYRAMHVRAPDGVSR